MYSSYNQDIIWLLVSMWFKSQPPMSIPAFFCTMALCGTISKRSINFYTSYQVLFQNQETVYFLPCFLYGRSHNPQSQSQPLFGSMASFSFPYRSIHSFQEMTDANDKATDTDEDDSMIPSHNCNFSAVV